MDARLAWQATQNLECSVVGQNLLDSHHLEFTDGAYLVSSQVLRGWYAMIQWTY
jgi:iron complex outermembrane receptor protein